MSEEVVPPCRSNEVNLQGQHIHLLDAVPITFKVDYAWICQEIRLRVTKRMEETTIEDAIQVLMDLDKEQG